MSATEGVKSACLPCVPPNALIFSNPSIKEARELTIGAKVLDAHGGYSEVTKIWTREYDGELVSIMIPYQKEKILLTPEHPVLAVRAHACRHSEYHHICYPKDNPRCVTCKEKRQYEPYFVPAGELSAVGVRNQWMKHMLLTPRLTAIEDRKKIKVSEIVNVGIERVGLYIKPRKMNAHNRGRSAVAVRDVVPINDDFMKLAGYYLSEGSCTIQKRGCHLRFDFGKTEEDYALTVKQSLHSLFGVEASVHKVGSVIRVLVSSTLLGNFFMNLFGKGALNKHIPRWIMLLPISKQASLLRAYWQGDGYQWMNKEETQMKLAATTVSRNLAYGLRTLLQRMGIICSFGINHPKNHSINGRVIRGNGRCFSIQIYPPSSIKLAKLIGYPLPNKWVFLQSHVAGFDEKWLYSPIKKIERVPYQGIVMNFTTEPDNTYTVNGVAVHNCAVGHFSTSATLLNEAIRFKKDGLASPQVLDDIAQAIGEQNALERIDLTPAKIGNLPDWEKGLANEALEKSRELRHKLESVQNMDELTEIAADTEEYFKYLNREWTSKRLQECPTCQINTDENIEEAESEAENAIEEPEEKVKVKVEAPKSKLGEYGRKASEARQKLLEEIHQARNPKD